MSGNYTKRVGALVVEVDVGAKARRGRLSLSLCLCSINQFLVSVILVDLENLHLDARKKRANAMWECGNEGERRIRRGLTDRPTD